MASYLDRHVKLTILFLYCELLVVYISTILAAAHKQHYAFATFKRLQKCFILNCILAFLIIALHFGVPARNYVLAKNTLLVLNYF